MLNDVWTDWDLIRKGQSVGDILRRCDNEKRLKFRLTEYDATILLHYYCQTHVEARDLRFFYGQVGGEMRQEQQANRGIKKLRRQLGQRAIDDMFAATWKEWDAKHRARLSPEDRELYDAVLQDKLNINEWHDRIHQRMDEPSCITSPSTPGDDCLDRPGNEM